jgi:hypothetical protein
MRFNLIFLALSPLFTLPLAAPLPSTQVDGHAHHDRDDDAAYETRTINEENVY